MNASLRPFFIVAIASLIPGPVQAAWPNLNPFSSSSGGSSSAFSTQDAWYPGKYLTSGWKSSPQTGTGSSWSIFPQSQPTFGRPSTFSRMMNGTKEAIYDTADFLNPFYSRPKYPGPFAPTGNNSYLNNRQPVRAKIEDTKTPWWAPYEWETEEKPQTVQDFLKLKKPGFDD